MQKTRALFTLKTLPRAAAAVLALGASGVALAQAGDPARGMVLYNQKVQPGSGGALFNCADCHGDGPTARVIWAARGITTEAQFAGFIASAGGEAMSFYRSSWVAQQRNDVGAYLASVALPPPGAPPPPPPGTPPTPAITPASPVAFATTVVGVRSARTTILVTNSSASAVTLDSPYVQNAGGNSVDFFLAPAPAGGPVQCANAMVLAPMTSCALGAEFQPSATGARAANWIFRFQGGVLSRLVNLAGAGSSAPVAAPATPTATPDPAMFSSTAVGATSAPLGVLLSNASGATITFAAQPVTIGGGNAGEFTQVTPPAGTTACPGAGGTIAAGVSCSIGVRFAPLAAGNRSASLTVQFGGGVASRVIPLQGTATAASSGPAPAPAPAPAPGPSPAPAPAAKDGGGAAGAGVLAGLLAALLAAGRRRRIAR